MKKTIVLLILLIGLFFSDFAFGKDNPQWAADNIPTEYQQDTKAVIRESIRDIEIVSPGKLIENNKQVITVFNDAGFEKAIFQTYYNKFISVSDINIEIYDAFGKRVRKARAREIKDYSAISGFSIYSDSRMKRYVPDYKSYPFTIVVSSQLKKKSAFFLPRWTPHEGADIPVLKSTLRVRFPVGYNLRFKEQNLPDVRKKNMVDGINSYEWSIENYEPDNFEPYAPNYPQTLPVVYLAPDKFEIDGIEGDMDSWESFGAFIWELNKDKQSLTEETVLKIKKLTDSLDNDFEKVKKIYEYMQNQTRYVSIQIGIGGWQPFDAETVDELGYGDCKALSNYMGSLLQVAGIKSNYTLVNAGTFAEPLIPDFPNNSFNHAILCVPLSTDTVWLECTSQNLPCGFLGDFTDGRQVLLIDSETGKIATTKVYSQTTNTRKTRGRIILKPNTNADITSHTVFRGTYYNNHIQVIHHMDEEDRIKRIERSLHMPGFKLNNYSFSEHKDIDPSIERELNFSVSGYAVSMGTKWLLPLNIIHRFNHVPRKMRSRKWPISVQRGWNEEDSWSISLPANIKIETLPSPVNIETPYGHYKSTVREKDGALDYTREFMVYKQTHQPGEYENFQLFLDAVAQADMQKCMISHIP